MEEEIRDKATELFDKGELEALQEVLIPYVEKEDPFALYLSARFSLNESKESEAEYSQRYVRQMISASEGGLAEASYQMGVNHLYGDDVPQDYKLASVYFERAISQGHSYSKFTYGFSLYYGTDQNPKNEKRGLALMREAAKERIEKAVNEIELINESKSV
jgi:TPR repeat protein